MEVTFYKDFNFKSSSSNFSKQNATNNGDDCLSCHFAVAPFLLQNKEKLETSTQNLNNSIKVLTFTKKTGSSHFQFFLREPPNFIF
jgi:hypothetical protein